MRLFTWTVLTVLCGSSFAVAAAGIDRPAMRPGQWDTAYHTEMMTTSEPPDGPSVALIDGRWLGACKP